MAALLLVMLYLAAVATADTMVLQPDGKILVAGRTWPESGSVARLNADGSLDTTFGAGGFVADHRLPGFRALALQPDGRIIGAAAGGFQIAGYLPDGAPDPEVAGGGVGGTDEPDQPHFVYANLGPAAIVVRPDDSIVVAGNRSSPGGYTDAWVRRYDAGGSLLETNGHVPRPGGGETSLSDLLEEPDGSLIGAGRLYPGPGEETQALLARFLPGSGTEFDPSFGGGAGLVRPSFLSKPRTSTFFNALAVAGGKLLAAGGTGGTLLLARFNQDGTLDTSFAEHGFSAPPISGPGDAASKGAFEEASTWANDVAVAAGGGALLGGGTSQWGEWEWTKDFGPHCTECPQPMLAKFRSDGSLDPSFGSGGLLRLTKPDGSTFLGEVEQVAMLGGGKYLVKGSTPTAGAGPKPWVARLNSDGSYDRDFGSEGLAVLRFPCTDQPAAEQRAAGCIGSAKVRLRVHGLRNGRPALLLRVHANVSWAPIRELSLTLPRGMRFTRAVKSKLQLAGAGVGTEVHVIAGNRKHGPSLSFQKIPGTPELRVTLRRGALRWLRRHPPQHRKLAFRIGVAFGDRVSAPEYGGNQTVVRRAG